MHDSELEARLRAVLREEGDRLPLHVDVERLEAQVAVRRRAQRASRFGLLAAGFGVVAFGLAVIGLNGLAPSTGPGMSVGPTGSPVASSPTPRVVMPAGLVTFEPRPGGTVLAEVAPTLSGDGERHTIRRDESMTAATSIRVACIDEDVQVTADGEVLDLAIVVITTDGQPQEHACNPDQEFGVAPALTDAPTTITIDVPPGIAYTMLAEAVPVPTGLPELDPLDSPIEVEGSSEIAVPDWSGVDGITFTTTVGTLDEAFAQHGTFACLGPGTMSVEFREQGANPADPPLAAVANACIGEPDGVQIAIGLEGPIDVVVVADARTAWHLVAASTGEIPAFTPPALAMTSWLGDTAIDGAATSGFVACGYTWDVGDTGSTGDQCGPPAWPDLEGESSVIARSGGELRLELADGWSIDRHAVRAAPYLQTGQLDPPVNVWELESAMDGETLTVPLELSNSRWVVWVETSASNGADSFSASYFFVVNVQP
jgi:hypothetical protein